MLHRREFLKIAAGTAGATLWSGASIAPPASLSVSNDILARVPLDFTGLSYESAQLSNPNFFSDANKELVRLFRELAPTGGVLRLGGNLSAFTGWRDDRGYAATPAQQKVFERGRSYWEWDLTDPVVKNGNRIAIFDPTAIRALSAFLDVTGWKVIYGLNFATGTIQQAVSEASFVYRTLGAKLLAFQLGNEVDFWRGGFRGADWEFASYLAEWRQWTRAVWDAAPGAPFAGPDVALRQDWVESMAAAREDLVLLSSHSYAMGPAGDPRMTSQHLLEPNVQLTKEIALARRDSGIASVPFRNTECNSCFHGGQRGASDSFASALWGADFMLALAAGGHAGVNLHGGGDGIYSPIVGDSMRGFRKRPLYVGMQLAQAFAGGTMLACSVSGISPLHAYAAQTAEGKAIALINKTGMDTEIGLPPDYEKALTTVRRLKGSAIDSDKDVALTESAQERQNGGVTWKVPAYSALLLQFES